MAVRPVINITFYYGDWNKKEKYTVFPVLEREKINYYVTTFKPKNKLKNNRIIYREGE